MKYGIAFILNFCLLMLLSSCRQDHTSGRGKGVHTPKPKANLDKDQLLELISHSERPYVLVNFFASWCRPCKEELPDLIAIQQDINSDVEVILVSVDNPNNTETKLLNFLNDLGVDFQTYSRSENEVALIRNFYNYYNGRIPLTLLYLNTGRQLEVFQGMTDREEIELVVGKYRLTESER